jgi:hypothetical protein
MPWHLRLTCYTTKSLLKKGVPDFRESAKSSAVLSQLLSRIYAFILPHMYVYPSLILGVFTVRLSPTELASKQASLTCQGVHGQQSNYLYKIRK